MNPTRRSATPAALEPLPHKEVTEAWFRPRLGQGFEAAARPHALNLGPGRRRGPGLCQERQGPARLFAGASQGRPRLRTSGRRHHPARRGGRSPCTDGGLPGPLRAPFDWRGQFRRLHLPGWPREARTFSASTRRTKSRRRRAQSIRRPAVGSACKRYRSDCCPPLPCVTPQRSP